MDAVKKGANRCGNCSNDFCGERSVMLLNQESMGTLTIT